MKPWYTSKTLWTNGVALVASVSIAFGWDLGLVPEAQASLVAGIMAAVNIILRFMTNKGVGK